MEDTFRCSVWPVCLHKRVSRWRLVWAVCLRRWLRWLEDTCSISMVKAFVFCPAAISLQTAYASSASSFFRLPPMVPDFLSFFFRQSSKLQNKSLINLSAAAISPVQSSGENAFGKSCFWVWFLCLALLTTVPLPLKVMSKARRLCDCNECNFSPFFEEQGTDEGAARALRACWVANSNVLRSCTVKGSK